jgi:hypothetical protein
MNIKKLQLKKTNAAIWFKNVQNQTINAQIHQGAFLI